MNLPNFATFWHGGPPSLYECACLKSFLARGYSLTLYTYGTLTGFPEGIQIGDAAAIAPVTSIDRYIVDGKPSMAHFTDYFRLLMFKETEHIWIDTDIFLLRDFDVDTTQDILGRETPTSLCNAIMKLKKSPNLDRLTQDVKNLEGQNMRWGASGPKALVKVYGPSVLQSAYGQEDFYPVHYDDYFKVFLPRYRDECLASCKNAYTLHLWNNLVTKTGIWKKIGPPKGSYLESLFSRVGIEFDLYYPEAVMENMVYNAVERAGVDSGIKKVVKLLVPGVKNAIYRRF